MAHLEKINISSVNWKRVKSNVLVVSVFEGGLLSKLGKKVDLEFEKSCTIFLRVVANNNSVTFNGEH